MRLEADALDRLDLPVELTVSTLGMKPVGMMREQVHRARQQQRETTIVTAP